jgi:hypothetical protein
MAGLVPAIHALFLLMHQDVDARDKRGHDGVPRAPGPPGQEDQIIPSACM